MSDAPPAAPTDAPPTSPTSNTSPTATNTTDDIEPPADGKQRRRARKKAKAEPQHAAPLTPGQRATRSLIEWVAIIGAALIVAFVVKTFLIQAFSIPSASMNPRLTEGDRVFVNKMSYRLHDVHRGDIVVFDRPQCDTGSDTDHLIKRVIATEGETVEARAGRVLIDGRALEEPYLPAGITTDNFGPVNVPDNHLWVMGDNRPNSKDSRFLCNNTTTFIPEDDVVGRAFVKVWPFSDLTLL